MLISLEATVYVWLSKSYYIHNTITRMFGGIETKLNEIEMAFRNEASKIRDTSKFISVAFSIK